MERKGSRNDELKVVFGAMTFGKPSKFLLPILCSEGDGYKFNREEQGEGRDAIQAGLLTAGGDF